MTALSGVRSSCDMLARNSDLCRLATSCSARLVSSSPKRRALTMASPDWLANVRTSSGVSASKPPLDFFLITRAPTSRSRRTNGTASSERQPSSSSTSRCSSRGTVPRSVISSVVRSDAERPTGEVERAMRRSRSRAVSASVPPAVARTWKLSSAGSYSMIEPPSAPVSRTAPLTISARTSSRSRLELTASTISRSTSSWVTLPASSLLRAPNAATSSTWRRTIAAWDANVLMRSTSPSSKGRASVRHTDRMPMTSPLRSIGADSRAR